MSDTLNSLLQAQHGQSVLQGIANPQLVNPLAAQNSAVQAAGNIYDLRQKQAKEAAGQAYQGAINPQTGELDTNDFRRRLAASGPAAMAAGESLLNIQTISSNQLEQSIKKAGWVSAAAGAALQAGDFSDGAMLRLFQTGLANGTLTMPEVQRQMQLMPPDAEGRQRWLQQHQDTAASVETQYKQRFGDRQQVSAGGTTEFPIVPSARSGQPGPSVQQTASPGEQGALVTIHVPVDAAGNPTTPDKAVRYDQKQVPRGSLPGLPMPGQPAAAPTNVIPANPNVPAGTPGGRNTPPAGSPLRPAQPAAAPATPAPAVTTPAPAPAAVPGVTTAGNVPLIPGAPPQGQPEKLKADVAAYTEDQANYPALVTRAQNMGHAYDALQVLKASTGKGAQGISDVRSFLGTIGLLPDKAVNDQRAMEIFSKYTERAMIDAAGGASTDMGKRMAEQANAGKLLGTPANLEILRNDLGKAIQSMAAYKMSDPALGGAGHLEGRAKVADTTDSRGFIWNTYSPEEQAQILADVKGTPADEKLHRAIGMSQDPKLGLQVPVSRPPVRQKQSFLVPPAPAQNALLMPGAGLNA